MQRFVLGVILAALLSAPVASAQSRTQHETPAMKGAVTARFDKEAGLKSADINVRSDNALVSLMRTVPYARAKVRAGDLARGVPGVRTVRNELRLSETRSDVKTSSDVKVRRSPTPPSAQTPPLSVSEKAPSSP